MHGLSFQTPVCAGPTRSHMSAALSFLHRTGAGTHEISSSGGGNRFGCSWHLGVATLRLDGHASLLSMPVHKGREVREASATETMLASLPLSRSNKTQRAAHFHKRHTRASSRSPSFLSSGTPPRPKKEELPRCSLPDTRIERVTLPSRASEDLYEWNILATELNRRTDVFFLAARGWRAWR